MKNQVDLGLLRSDSAAIGDKRCNDELGEKQESVRKRSKLRDLPSVFRSEENSTYHFKNGEASDKFQLGGEISQITDVPMPFGLAAGSAIEVNRPLDLNSDVNGNPGCPHKYVAEHYDKCVTTGGAIGLDLNAEDVVSSLHHHDSFYKNDDHLKSRRDASECGSTTGPVLEKDSLRVWKEMKENGFISSSSHGGGGVSVQTSLISSIHGGIPMPKQRGKKNKSDVLKKKMELAKKEQVDRFTKIAAPSGLLNGLNPGIINHVRNKKQVHSIIEAIVRSEKLDHDGESKQDTHQITETKQTCNVTHSGVHQISCSQGCGVSAMVSGSKQLEGYNVLSRGNLFSSVNYTSGKSLVSHSTAVIDSKGLALNLSSTKDDSRTCSNVESMNVNSVSSLSVRAAGVASQWLELLHQDIKGRLSALRRSKKRVRAVITTELPFLISKEFASNQENDPCILKNLGDGQSNNTSVSAMHQTRWSKLFDHMDKALSEEEKQLESWFNQVKEMQLHCDLGMQSLQWSTVFGFVQQETSENSTRIGKSDGSERDLAVRAAAASIYSTCSFLMSKENVSCC